MLTSRRPGRRCPPRSVGPGESPEDGALREAWEEVGVRGVRVLQYLGMFPWYSQVRQELHHRHVYHMTAEAELPEQWDHVVSGGIEEKGMRFRCYWLDAARAVDALSGEQGLYHYQPINLGR